MGQLSKAQPCLPVRKRSAGLEDVGRSSAIADVKGRLGEVSQLVVSHPIIPVRGALKPSLVSLFFRYAYIPSIFYKFE